MLRFETLQDPALRGFRPFPKADKASHNKHIRYFWLFGIQAGTILAYSTDELRSEESRNNVPKVLRLTQSNMIGKYRVELDQERCLSQSIVIRYFIYLPPAFPSGRSGESQLR